MHLYTKVHVVVLLFRPISVQPATRRGHRRMHRCVPDALCVPVPAAAPHGAPRSPLDEADELLLQLALPARLLEVVDAAQVEHDVARLAEVYLGTR